MSFKKLFILASLVLAPTILVAMEPNHSHPRLLNLNALVSAIEKGIRGHALIGVGEMLNSPNAGALSEEQFDQLYVLSKNIFKNLPDNHVSFTRASNIDRLLYFCVCLKGLKFPKVLFTPVPYRDLVSPTLAQALGALILNESHSVSVCCYHLTLFNIAEALVACRNEGSQVEVVIDQEMIEPIQAVRHLVGNDVSVMAPRNHSYEMNHHKFIIFESNVLNKNLVWSGSYNLTGNANENSWDDVTISDDNAVVQRFRKRFEDIKNRSELITLEELQNTPNNPNEASLRRNNVPKELWKK